MDKLDELNDSSHDWPNKHVYLLYVLYAKKARGGPIL